MYTPQVVVSSGLTSLFRNTLTGISVFCERSSTNRFLWLGERCGTTMNAKLLVNGIFLENVSIVPRPPAEEPLHT